MRHINWVDIHGRLGLLPFHPTAAALHLDLDLVTRQFESGIQDSGGHSLKKWIYRGQKSFCRVMVGGLPV